MSILKKYNPFVYISKIYSVIVNISRTSTITVTKYIHI